MNETTTGAPLTATVGERLKGDPHVEEARKAVEGAQADRRGQGRRPFPWGALALAVVAWAFATAIGRRMRSRAQRVQGRIRSRARRIRGAVAGLGQGARRVARRSRRAFA